MILIELVSAISHSEETMQMVGISILKHSRVELLEYTEAYECKKRVFLTIHPYPIVSVTCR